MRSFVLSLVLLAGCYNPKLGSPGYYCHLEDHPACPDGQECMQGRCQTRGVHFVGRDMAGINNPIVDMAGQLPGPMDLSMPVTGMTGCSGYVKCLVACGTSPCPTCDNNVTMDGMTKYQMALSCDQNWCLNSASPKACMINAAGTMLVDASTAQPGACNACLSNSTAALFGTACPTPSSANCNPSVCTSSTNACLSSTP